MRTQLALLASAVLLLSGCASSAGGSDPLAPSALDGDWVLESGSDGEGDLDLAGSTITLTVEDGVVTGRAPCNSYSGTAAGDGAAVSFSALSTTEAACRVQALMDLERRYVDALGAVTAARVDGAALEVGRGTDVALRFVRVAVDEDGDGGGLEGTAWSLATVVHGDVAAAAVGTGSLSFSPDGTSLTGSAGCHGFAAGYTAAGGVVALSDLEIAHQACGDETAAQEDSVFAVLGDGLVMTRDGDVLTATNAVGGVPVSLVYSFQAS